uniref:KTSC domain-containing protein n=1 Tax=Heterorhabditis bacteriophora TaxID=37862 RepID=A0A1I7XJV8_HETBA
MNRIHCYSIDQISVSYTQGDQNIFLLRSHELVDASRKYPRWVAQQSPDSWPSNSSGLNPMDFAIFSISANKPSRASYSNFDSLTVASVKSWDEISEDELRPIVGTFERRLRARVTAEGKYFDHLMN